MQPPFSIKTYQMFQSLQHVDEATTWSYVCTICMFVSKHACVCGFFPPSRPLLVILGSLLSGSSLFLLQSLLLLTGLIYTRTHTTLNNLKGNKLSNLNLSLNT